MRGIYLLPILLLLVFSYSFASKIKVEQFVCSENVVNKTPVNISKTFSIETGKIYCFSKVRTDKIPTYIYHVWYKNGKKFSEIRLNIKYNSYRTWSYKTLYPNDIGKWKVELLDRNRKKIAETFFEVVVGSKQKDKLNNDSIKEDKAYSGEISSKSEGINDKSEVLNKNSSKIFNSNSKRLEDTSNKDKSIDNREKSAKDNFYYEKYESKVDNSISKSFYLVLLVIFYMVFFPTVYFLNRKVHLK